MEKVYIGKVVNTHGIKGEIRILSHFPYKEKAFRIGNHLIIEDEEYEIKTYRVHKDYDMVTLNNYQNINEVLFLIKKEVYIQKEELDLGEEEILDEELIEYTVLTNDGKRGIIKEIFLASKENKILRIMLDKKQEVLVPLKSPMVQKIDKKKKIVQIELIKGM